MNAVNFGSLFDFQKKSKIKAGDGLPLIDGNFPFFTSSNILSKSLNDYNFEGESLIFGTGGSASVHYCNERFSASTDCFVTMPKVGLGIYTKYVYYFLIGNIDLIESGFKGAGLKHVSKQHISDLKIPVTTLNEQKKIAAILDAADDYRQKTKALIEKYDQLTQSLFLDMFGDPVTNPKGWELVTLGDLCEVGSSKRVFVDELVEEGIPFYRGTEVGKLAEGSMIQPELFITNAHYEKLKKEKPVPKIGDLLMPSICRDGRIWIVNSNAPFYFKDGRVLWVSIDSQKINSLYLRYRLKSAFQHNYDNIASGTTFAELKIVALKKLSIFYPELILQNQFAERVAQIEKQKQQAEVSLVKAEELFNSLLQRAFKGELTN